VQSPSSSAQQALIALGQRLEDIRKDAGLSARALAARAGWHESKCSRLQSGKATPSAADIHAWTLHCGVPELAPDLIEAARGVEGMYVEWRRRTRAGLRHVQQAGAQLYERTRSFRIYEPGVVPGLLQTPTYATALMGAIIAFQKIFDDTEAAVAVRIERQRVLHQGGTFAFLMEESALRARVADDEVMAGQLGHLLQAASLPSVSLGIIPASARRGMWPVEGFWILDEDRVLVELVTAEINVTQPREVDLYARTFTELCAIAAYGSAARALITAAIDSLG
jgi:transcriptional regulator with XRE-family HTH domain